MLFNVRKSSEYRITGEVEIKSLEELMEFVQKNGSIIINPVWPPGGDWNQEKTPEIEIYDSWRE